MTLEKKYDSMKARYSIVYNNSATIGPFESEEKAEEWLRDFPNCIANSAQELENLFADPSSIEITRFYGIEGFFMWEGTFLQQRRRHLEDGTLVCMTMLGQEDFSIEVFRPNDRWRNFENELPNEKYDDIQNIVKEMKRDLSKHKDEYDSGRKGSLR